MSFRDTVARRTHRYMTAVTSRLPGGSYFTSPEQFLILVSTSIILITVIVIPLGLTFYYSFAPQYPLPPEGYTHFTTQHWEDLLFGVSASTFVEITKNSILYGLGTAILAISGGFIMAVLEEKYLSGSRWRYFLLLPYAIPMTVAVTGWILLLGRRGVLNILFMDLFNLSSPPLDIFSLLGMIWVDGIHTMPIAFLLLTPSIRAIPAAVDEAALMAGASRLRVYRSILIPMIFPSILSITIFVFAKNIAAVVAPSVLGINDQIFTWGSAIPFLFLYGEDLQYGLTMAFSMVITIFSGLLMIVYYWSVQRSEKYTTVTGAGRAKQKVYEIGPLKRVASHSFFLAYIVIAAMLPLLIIFWDSIAVNYIFSLDTQYTLQRYVDLFAGVAPGIRNTFWRAVRNSLTLGFAVPSLALLIAYLMSYANQSLNVPFSKFNSWLASVPLSVPAIVIGFAFVVTFIRTPLYGTITLIILAMLTRAIPTAMRYTDPALIRLGGENVEMALICGSREFRTLIKTVIPLTKSDFIAAWMHLYVSSVREVTIPLLLAITGVEVIGVEILYLLISGFFKTASTISVVLIVLATLPYMLLQFYRSRAIETV